MTPKTKAFLDTYLANGRDGDAAYRAAYGKPGPWRTLLARGDVQAAIDAAENPAPAIVERTVVVDPEKVARIIRDYEDIYTADPRKLITHRRINCRHCHGIDHKYRWDDQAEYVNESARIMKQHGNVALLPGCEGGFGFRRQDPPHEQCPKCLGEGHSDIFIADFGKLDAKTLKLLAGVKMTKDGIQVLMHDQAHARDMHAKILGLLIDRTKSEDDPIPPAPVALTPEQIADVLKALGEKY